VALRHDDGVRVKSLIPIAAPRRGSGVGDGSCEVVRGIRNYSGEVPGNGGLSRARVGARPVLISCQLRQATQWSRSGLWKAAIHHTPQQHGSRRSIPSGAILARLAALKRERSLDAGWRPSAAASSCRPNCGKNRVIYRPLQFRQPPLGTALPVNKHQVIIISMVILVIRMGSP